MEARGIYWLIVALHGITPEEIEDIPDAFGAAGVSLAFMLLTSL